MCIGGEGEGEGEEGVYMYAQPSLPVIRLEQRRRKQRAQGWQNRVCSGVSLRSAIQGAVVIWEIDVFEMTTTLLSCNLASCEGSAASATLVLGLVTLG